MASGKGVEIVRSISGERAIALAAGHNLTPDDLPERVRSNGQTSSLIGRARERRMTLRELEKEYIIEALRMTGGNKSAPLKSSALIGERCIANWMNIALRIHRSSCE